MVSEGKGAGPEGPLSTFIVWHRRKEVRSRNIPELPTEKDKYGSIRILDRS
jgi:hypothetical protein